ncbi:DUF4339 domain-containing protein [Verrucomicrobiales bacterium BCK34]|nr:DUF4339 domain-containing protein [Verrucomicrobiales bacterium BCK34]
MRNQFYYADENSQPVGPLSLDDIRKMARAGVVPADVMVCEAGGENWRSLKTFDEANTAGKSLFSSLPQFTGTTDPVEMNRHLKLTFTVAIAISLVACGLNAASNRAAIDSGSYFDPNKARENFVLLLWILSGAAQLALIYQLTRALPKTLQFTSPLKAAGFFLIPVFSIYWVFRLFSGFAKSIQTWSKEIEPKVSKRVAWLTPFAIIAAIFVSVSEIQAYYSIFTVAEDSDIRTLKSDFILSDLTNALGLAAFFHFSLSIIHILRGLLDPGDYEKEGNEAEQRGFWTLRGRAWNPSWAFLFIFAALIPWK